MIEKLAHLIKTIVSIGYHPEYDESIKRYGRPLEEKERRKIRLNNQEITRLDEYFNRLETIPRENTLLHLMSLQDKPINNLLRKLETIDPEKSKIFINTQNQDGLTALHIAIQKNQGTIAQALLKHSQTDANIFDNAKKTPLHYAIELQQDPSIIQTLYSKTDPDHSKIWSKGLMYPGKYKKIDANLLTRIPLRALNPQYCLLAKPILDLYHFPVETLLQKAGEGIEDTAMYTLMVVPALFQKILSNPSYFETFTALLHEIKDTKLASLVLQNDQFTDFLFKEETLKTLISLSVKNLAFSFDLLQTHHNRIAQHPAHFLFLTNLKKRYEITQATFEALEEKISDKLAISDIFDWKNNKDRDLLRETPLHIAAYYGGYGCVLIESEFRIDAEEWGNTRDQDQKTPLDIALGAPKPHMATINTLYELTTDCEVLSAYLPEYLQDSLLKKTTRTIKACIEAYPFQLTNPLIHPQSFEAYQKLKKIIEQDNEIEEKLSSLLEAFSKDPITLLVSISLPVFKEYIDAILSDSKKTKKIFSYIEGSIDTDDFKFVHAEKILLRLLPQAFTLQKTVEDKQSLLSLYSETHAINIPRVALYLLEEHENICGQDILINIIDTHCLKISNIDLIQNIKHQLQKRSSEYYNRTRIFNELRQTHAYDCETIHRRDKAGNTLLHRIISLAAHIRDDVKGFYEKSDIKSDREDISQALLQLIELSIGSFEALIPTNTQKYIQAVKNQYTNNGGNTFLHVAATRTEEMTALIKTIIQKIHDKSYSGKPINKFLQTLSHIKNHEGKIPLVMALEANNIAASKFLIRYVKDIEILANFFNIFITQNDNATTLHKKLQSDFFAIKKEYRLLNNTYRGIFKKCLSILLSYDPSKGWQSSIRTMKKIQATLQKNTFGVYVLVDHPRIFQFVLNAPKPQSFFKIFQNRTSSSMQSALLEALNNLKFYTALKQSPHFQYITQTLAKQFELLPSDTTGTEIEPDRLLENIRLKLEKPLLPVCLERTMQAKYSLNTPHF